MTNCRVSIIIPAYNHAAYLGAAIESVLQQHYTAYEIIVVDDGSQDQTPAVVAHFADRVQYIRQTNQGVSAARNRGIAAAKGELIALLDADDLYEPTFLSTLVALLDANPAADGVYCRCQTVDEANQPLPQQIGKVVAAHELYSVLLQGGFFPPLCMLVYRACYTTAGRFDQAFQGSADWDMWLRLAKQFTIVGTTAVLARYRLVAQSMSSNPRHMLQDQLGVLTKQVGALTAATPGTVAMRQAYARVYLRTATEYLQRQQVGEAYQAICAAIRCEPAILRTLDFYYEIGYGKQPRGFRGHYQTVDVRHSVMLFEELFGRLFNDDHFAAQLNGQRCTIYAHAYFVLGMISYGSRRFAFARTFFRRTVTTDPTYLLRFTLVSTWLKSLLPLSIVDLVRQRRRPVVYQGTALRTQP